MTGDYGKWVRAAEQLLIPQTELMLAGHWLAVQGGEELGFSRSEIEKRFREGLVAATDWDIVSCNNAGIALKGADQSVWEVSFD